MVSPLFEKARTTSSAVTMPKSPWIPSAGWRKMDGVPVLDKVAATLRAMCPDFPHAGDNDPTVGFHDKIHGIDEV